MEQVLQENIDIKINYRDDSNHYFENNTPFQGEDNLGMYGIYWLGLKYKIMIDLKVQISDVNVILEENSIIFVMQIVYMI